MAREDRRILVMKHVVDEYVRTSRPVGSEHIARWLGVSSASVRGAMNDLLHDGRLMQPHASAGRVPTDTGYRFYVDHLLGEYRLAEAEGEAVQRTLDLLQSRLDRMLTGLTALLSQWGQCIAFITVPELERCAVHRVDITRVSERKALLILVFSNGMVENRMLTLPAGMSRSALERIAARLNERLFGLEINAIKPRFLESVFAEIRLSEYNISRGVMALFEQVINTMSRRVYVDGADDILAQPEFQDAARLRPVLETVSGRNTAAAVFQLPTAERLPEITIGHENIEQRLYECSVIKSHFRFGDRTAGAMGLIGPRRMHYARLSCMIRHIAGALSDTLSHFSLE